MVRKVYVRQTRYVETLNNLLELIRAEGESPELQQVYQGILSSQFTAIELTYLFYQAFIHREFLLLRPAFWSNDRFRLRLKTLQIPSEHRQAWNFLYQQETKLPAARQRYPSTIPEDMQAEAAAEIKAMRDQMRRPRPNRADIKPADDPRAARLYNDRRCWRPIASQCSRPLALPATRGWLVGIQAREVMAASATKRTRGAPSGRSGSQRRMVLSVEPEGVNGVSRVSGGFKERESGARWLDRGLRPSLAPGGGTGEAMDPSPGPLPSPVQSDHWYHELFKAMPDLVRHLLPELAVGEGGADAEPAAPGPGEGFSSPDARATTYTFRPVVLKKSAHSPDAVLWPRELPGGSEALPVVLVEVQMHSDPGFHRRLAAETFRLLQQQGPIEHLRVLVLLAHRRLQLGPTGPPLLRRFLEQDVSWVDLESISRQPSLDPSLALLTLPVQKEADFAPCCQQLLQQRPDWIELILPILSERFPGLTTAQLMTTYANFRDFWRHTPAFQDILQEGRSEGLDEGRRALVVTLLQRRCGPLSPATSARIEDLGLPQLQELALALLDFQGAEDLNCWLEQQDS